MITKIWKQITFNPFILLVIRLSRTGRSNQAAYRVVVAEHSAPVQGKCVEIIGFYNPAEDKKFEVKEDRVKYWMSVGAKPSDSVASLLKASGMEGMDEYLAPRDKQRKKKNAEEEEEAAPEAAAEAPAEGGEEAAPAEEAPAEPEPAPEEKAEEPKEEEKPAEKAPVEPEAPAEEPAAEEAPKEETPEEPAEEEKAAE